MLGKLSFMAIRFLSKIEQWKDFSNLAFYPIELQGEVWKSVEHYYQFKKFEKSDPAYALRIKEASTPKDAKVLSLKNNNYSDDWDNQKVSILKAAVRKKFDRILNWKNYFFQPEKRN